MNLTLEREGLELSKSHPHYADVSARSPKYLNEMRVTDRHPSLFGDSVDTAACERFEGGSQSGHRFNDGPPETPPLAPSRPV